ncbi:MAG TPA: diaminopimelate decarboxylase [Longimicrobiales bacterium]|nr:diaminopimelate decarboxylase [Longimicrobiales bacterium]
MPANFAYRNGTLHCEDVAVESVVEQHGTPLYLYSRNSIVERLRSLDTAFEPLDRLIAYSVKANGNLSILRLLAAEGCGADIVSGGELYRALRAGMPAERIVFSGVGKTATEMDAGLEAGILCFNVESAGELRLLAERGRALGRTAPVSLRINPDIESPTPHAYTRTGHRETKFGIPSEDAVGLYRLAAELDGVEPVGIDAHIGSQIVEPGPYQQSLLHLLELVDTLRGEGITLRTLDLGGGFGVAYEAAADPAPSSFAERIVPHLATSGLRLILEPGRYVIGHAGVLLTRVLYVKRTGSKTFVITDAGMNDLLRPSHYASYHRVEPVRTPVHGRENRHVDVVGPICESGDFLALDREMPLPEGGELLAIHTVGAYGFSMASTYNARTRPAEVLIEGDRARLIRRRETYADLIRGEEDLLIE